MSLSRLAILISAVAALLALVGGALVYGINSIPQPAASPSASAPGPGASTTPGTSTGTPATPPSDRPSPTPSKPSPTQATEPTPTTETTSSDPGHVPSVDCNQLADRYSRSRVSDAWKLIKEGCVLARMSPSRYPASDPSSCERVLDDALAKLGLTLTSSLRSAFMAACKDNCRFQEGS